MSPRDREKMAAAFAAVEAQNSAGKFSTDPHAARLAEWARKHRTQLEAAAPAGERDPLTLNLFDAPGACPVCHRTQDEPSTFPHCTRCTIL